MSIGSVVTNNLPELPPCDLCTAAQQAHPDVAVEIRHAHYDGKTIYGPWAYMCERHFKELGVGLGTGRGQLLIASNPTKES
jgi:hypothetical protein